MTIDFSKFKFENLLEDCREAANIIIENKGSCSNVDCYNDSCPFDSDNTGCYAAFVMDDDDSYYENKVLYCQEYIRRLDLIKVKEL